MEVEADLNTSSSSSRSKRKGRLSRGRRSVNIPLYLDADEVDLCKDIPNDIEPNERLELLVRKSIQFAIEACIPKDQASEQFMQVKDSVDSILENLKADGLFVECTTPIKRPRVNLSPNEDVMTKETQASIIRFEKERDRWEQLLKKYKAMEQSYAKDDAAIESGGSRERSPSYCASKLQKLETHLQRIRLQLKVIKQRTSDMQLAKKQAEDKFDSLAGQLYAEINDCAHVDVKQIVSSLIN